MTARRGLTLVELLVALVLAGIVGTAIIRMLNSSQRVTRVQFGRMDAQQNATAALYYLGSALRELSASEGDVYDATATGIRYRAMRWTGVACSGVSVSGSDLLITLRRAHLFGAYRPNPLTDSLLVFHEKTPTTRADDVWLVGRLTDTATVNCPDGSGGARLSLRITAASGGNAALATGFTLGSPIRAFQAEEVSVETDVAGESWFVRRAADVAGTWGAFDRLAGPLSGSGLLLQYFDTLNVETNVLARIASVRAVVLAQSADNTGVGTGTVTDSIITRIAMRNNLRF